MKHRRNHIYKDILNLVFPLFLTIITFVLGCVGGSETGNPECSFKSDQDLTTYLKDQFAQSAQPTTLWTLDNDAQPGWTSGHEFAAEKGYSETNIQETGVDESDMVKTDGTCLYVARDHEVRIISAIPPQSMQEESSIPVNGTIDSLYLYNKVLVILYTPSDGEGSQWLYSDNLKMIDIGMPYWNPIKGKFGILIADVSEPAAPSIIKDFQAEGSLLSSRLAAGNLHVISQFIADLPPLELWYDETQTSRQSTVDKNSQALEGLTLDDLIPSYSQFDGNGSLISKGRLVAAQNFIRPKAPAGGTIVSIVTVSLSDLAKDFSSVGFAADIHHVYASTQAIYLISTIYQGNPGTNDLTDPDVYQTRIYQFDISGNAVTFSAEGQVKGHILNQFSLGEYDGVLRIATTTGYAWDGSASNHVFCMEKQGNGLSVIGQLQNLAQGERLYSARFIRDKGFLVTFVEVDPLFTIDLSNPQNPVLAGELKVPGYSTYLHPLGDGYLLAIGKDAVSDNGSVLYQGLNLSIFDIRDFASPKLLATEKIGDRGTDSEALYNHKALSFWPEKNLLALPVNLYEFLTPQENPWDYGTNTFAGVYVYQLTEAYHFKYLGRMKMPCDDVDMISYSDWTRGIFIDDYVYSINSDAVRAAEINSIKEPFYSLDLFQ